LANGFQMVSNGTQYEVYIPLYKQVHVGDEDDPLVKSECKLSDQATKLLSLRPRQIIDAFVPDFRPLLDSSLVGVSTYTIRVPEDQRSYFIVDFSDITMPRTPKLLQRIWFDLST